MAFRIDQRLLATLQGTRIWRPIFPITVGVSGRVRNCEIRLDTGADYTVMPTNVAKYVGLTFAGPPPIRMRAAIGQIFRGHRQTVTLSFADSNGGWAQWTSNVVFSDAVQHALAGYVGFIEFFDCFVLGAEVVLDPRHGFPGTFLSSGTVKRPVFQGT